MSLTEQNLREKEFHNKLHSKNAGRFENIFYKAISNAWEDFFDYLKLNAKNSVILDYGCGIGPVISKVIEFNIASKYTFLVIAVVFVIFGLYRAPLLDFVASLTVMIGGIL